MNLRGAALLVLGLALGLALGGCKDSTPAPTRAVELSDCHLHGLSRAALCGVVEVHEDHSDPASRVIPLRVAVLEARGRAPEPDAVFFLAGGPGQAATEAFPPVIAAYDELARARDIVLVDIRGTGSSTALDCDPGDSLVDSLEAEFDPEDLERCLEALPGDPIHHTTRHVVADLEAVRAALGYERINLVGGSYGTRLALEYARHHGDRVRTMVLDGVAPPQMALPEGFAVDAQAVFDALVADCSAEPGCAAAFPDVAGDLERARARLRAGPVRATIDHPRSGEPLEIEVDEVMLVASLRNILYAPQLSVLVPLVLRRAADGDFAPLLGQAAVFAESMGDSLSAGLMLSILCAEDLPRIDPEAQRSRDASTFLGASIYTIFTQACARWPHAPLPESAGEPVHADAPTLLLSGTLDPVTPPRWAELAAQTLPSSTHVIVPNAGHGTLTLGCVPDRVTEFIASADVGAVDGSCVELTARPAFFIDFAGPSP